MSWVHRWSRLDRRSPQERGAGLRPQGLDADGAGGIALELDSADFRVGLAGMVRW